jgi:hypothetical protein
MYSLDDMEDKELILALIIADIADEITAEDRIALKQMIMDNEAIEQLYNETHDLLMRDDIVKARAESGPYVPPFAADKRPFNRYVIGTGIAAMVLSIVLFITFSTKPVAVIAASRDSLQLIVDNKQMLDMDTYDTLSIGTGVNTAHTYFLKANNRNGSLWVPAGRTFHLILSDGTALRVNAATTIKFPFTFNQERHITISGNAEVDVAPDAAKPFFVSLPNTKIQVLGTRFRASSYDGHEGVSLMSGKVAFVKGKESFILNPGEEMYTQPNLSLKKSFFDIKEMESGHYKFDNISITEVAVPIRKFFRMDVIIEKPVSNEKYFGYVDYNKSVKSFLEYLRTQNPQLKYNIIGNTIHFN